MARTIEVDENAFANSQRLTALVQKMLSHPEARKKVLAAQKDIDPNVVIPEIDARKPVEEGLAAIQKEMRDFMEAQKAEKEKERDEARKNQFITEFERGRQMLREAGVTDEGLKKVEELMTRAGIVDHEIGWAAFSKLNPEPEPAPPAPNFGFGGIFSDVSKNPDEFIKSMHASRGNDEAALDKRIHEVLTEERQRHGAPQQRSPLFGRR